jgi:RND family efflux transporter MFP subunit
MTPSACRRASFAICGATFLAACGQGNQYAAPPPPKVTVMAPVAQDVTRYFDSTGNATSVNSVQLVARVQGFVQAISYTDGQFVKKGTSLFTIEPEPYKLKVDAAKAAVTSSQATLTQAQAEYQRQADLVQKQVSTQANYDKALAQRDSAQADLQSQQANEKQAEINLGYTDVTAPFDGVVTARETDIGALINAGSGTGGGNGPELFRVADLHMMRVYVQVPQQLSAGIKDGLSAELHLPQYPDKTFKATVATTSSAINTNARTLLVELHADNPDTELQPGAYAQVDFELPSNPNIVRIPTSALVFRERGMEVAMLAPGDTVELKPITLGRNLGTEVEVIKGLTLSDRVINSPPDSLATGDKVRVIGAPAAGAGGLRSNSGDEAVAAARSESKLH